MNRHSQVNAYREREVLSADRGKLLVLTFDALVASMTRARLAVSRDLASDALSRARDLLAELLVTLDRAKGGAIADQLSALYVFVLSELDAIAIRPDAARLDRNLHVIQELRDAFAQIASSHAPVS